MTTLLEIKTMAIRFCAECPYCGKQFGGAKIYLNGKLIRFARTCDKCEKQEVEE